LNRLARSPGFQRLLWFIGLWAAGVIAVGIVGFAIRIVLL
jgi:preprotein translocase subunit Sss1